MSVSGSGLVWAIAPGHQKITGSLDFLAVEVI